ncbi:MAG: AI-2E family transporter [Jatrophihabitans sp.]|uniref:AI-2E family transporter n=1 Tax=Jatrophihabitans sp. TaxID=1932789 RepID=UPI003F7D8FFC
MSTPPPQGSLFESGPPDSASFGVPGVPISRNAAFYRGFVATLGVLLALVLGMAVREASQVIELVVVAAFLAIGLNPIVEFAIRRGWKRAWAVLLVGVLFLGLVTVIVYSVGGVLRNQLVSLINDAPRLIDDLRRNRTVGNLDRKYHFLTDLQKKIESGDLSKKTFGGIFDIGVSVVQAVANVLVIFVLTLYFLASLPTVKLAMYSLAPASRRERVAHLGDEILRRVGRYVIGAFLVATLAGTVTAAFLVSSGLGNYALPLALLVALLDLVPLVGSILGALTVTIVAFANSLGTGIAAAIFYLVYETLEGYVIYPRVMRSSIDVPEYVTIVAVLLGGAVDGIVGALIALPLVAAILLLAQEVWVRRQDLN